MEKFSRKQLLILERLQLSIDQQFCMIQRIKANDEELKSRPWLLEMPIEWYEGQLRGTYHAIETVLLTLDCYNGYNTMQSETLINGKKVASEDYKRKYILPEAR